MRRLVLAATFSALAPMSMAMAQLAGPGPDVYGGHVDPSMQRTTTAMNSQAPMEQQQRGENCGTPDDWKACPPLPRHPLQYYPPNK